jgi:hypothetical protein
MFSHCHLLSTGKDAIKGFQVSADSELSEHPSRGYSFQSPLEGDKLREFLKSRQL